MDGCTIEEFSGSKLMIVDDTIENINLLSCMFEPYHLRISVANSGSLALKNVGKIHPDLILMDVMMPDMNGYETCAAIKKNDGLKDIPIIFVTARTDMDGLAQGFAVGAVDYITKPVQREEVLSRVATHLKIRRLMASQQSIIKTLQSSIRTDTSGVASMGSDLRDPLSTIMGYTELLIEKATDESQPSFIKPLKSIQRAGHQLLSEINDLVDLACLDSGCLEIYQDDFLVASLQDALLYRLTTLPSKGHQSL